MIIIVTGATKGLGAAIVHKMAANLSKVTFLLNARNETELQKMKTDVEAAYQHTVHIFPADLSIKNAVLAYGEWCLQFGTPDILVNNAGSFIPGNVYDEADEALEKMLAVNLLSAYHLTRKLLPAMMMAKHGHIFNICSIASLQAYEGGGAYSISKYALAGFTDNLRKEMMPHNIKVTGVYPGAAFTDSWSGSGVDTKRIMEANDIAEMVYAATKLSPQACVESIILRPQLGDL